VEKIYVWANVNDIEKLNSNPHFMPICKYITGKEKYTFLERSEYGKVCLGNLEIIFYLTSADLQKLVSDLYGIKL